MCIFDSFRDTPPAHQMVARSFSRSIAWSFCFFRNSIAKKTVLYKKIHFRKIELPKNQFSMNKIHFTNKNHQAIILHQEINFITNKYTKHTCSHQQIYFSIRTKTKAMDIKGVGISNKKKRVLMFSKSSSSAPGLPLLAFWGRSHPGDGR